MCITLILTLIAERATIVSWVGFRMARGEAGNECLEHAHRMRVAQVILRVSLHEAIQLVIDRIACSDFRLKAQELALRWKLAIDQQESSLSESRPSCKLVNRISSVFKDSLLAVDVGDSRDAIDCVHIGRIEGTSDIARDVLDFKKLHG